MPQKCILVKKSIRTVVKLYRYAQRPGKFIKKLVGILYNKSPVLELETKC